MEQGGVGVLSFVVALCQKGVWAPGWSHPGRPWRRPGWKLGSSGPSSHPSLPSSTIRLGDRRAGHTCGEKAASRSHVQSRQTHRHPQTPSLCAAGMLIRGGRRLALCSVPTCCTILGGQQHLAEQPFHGGPVLFQPPGVHPYSNFHGSSRL